MGPSPLLASSPPPAPCPRLNPLSSATSPSSVNPTPTSLSTRCASPTSPRSTPSSALTTLTSLPTSSATTRCPTGPRRSTHPSLPTSPTWSTPPLSRLRLPPWATPPLTGAQPPAFPPSRARVSAVPAGPSPQLPQCRTSTALKTVTSTRSLSSSLLTASTCASAATVVTLPSPSDTGNPIMPCPRPATLPALHLRCLHQHQLRHSTRPRHQRRRLGH